MKTKLLFTALIFASTMSSEAQTIYSNNFNSATGITVIDADGDSNNWGLITGSPTTVSWGLSGNFVGSRSWNPSNGTPAGSLTPNNFLITLPFTIPESADPTLMSFKLGSNDTAFFNERIAIYLAPVTATTASQYSALTPVYDYSLQQSDALSAQTRTVDISAFEGQTVKIVLRHFNSVNQGLLYFDNLLVSQGTLATENFTTSQFSVYPNPAINIINVSSKTQTGITAILIVDLNGRIVKRANFEKISEVKMDISELSSGIYIMKIDSESGSADLKVVKK